MALVFPVYIVPMKLFDRIKVTCQQRFLLVQTLLINLNLYPLRTFQNHVDQTTAKRLGRWATRLYIGLLVISLVTLVIYTAIQPRILTATFDSPSFHTYNRLARDHGETLQCTCSSIATAYDRFVTIEPLFHQVKVENDFSSSSHGSVLHVIFLRSIIGVLEFVYDSCVAKEPHQRPRT